MSRDLLTIFSPRFVDDVTSIVQLWTADGRTYLMQLLFYRPTLQLPDLPVWGKQQEENLYYKQR